MTKRRKLLPRLVLAAILVGLPAAADAPRDPPQYIQFDSDDPTIKDFFTKLEWDRRGFVEDSDWDGASVACGFKFSNTGRLPTIKELLTILDEDPHQEFEFGDIVSKMIDAQAFDGTPVALPYWSSTPAPGSDKFWTLSFSTGAMEARGRTQKANARCVR